MSYVNLDDVHRPANGLVAPYQWGDQVNDNIKYLYSLMGLTGTTGRFVGVSNGAPSSGTYNVNDFTLDPSNRTFWVCTTAGTPGTWRATRVNPVSSTVGSASSLGTSYANLNNPRATATIPAGTWLIQGVITFNTSPANPINLFARVSDGTNVYGLAAASVDTTTAGSQQNTVPLLTPPFTLSSATTIDIQASTSATGGTLLVANAQYIAMQAG